MRSSRLAKKHRLRTQQGQSLIVAVIVLFVLLFIGGIFVGIVARNLLNSGRATDTLAAASLAEAGARWAGDQLVFSPEGADWRPAPTPALSPQDPDKPWLDRGFSRIILGDQGRALVRVSYKTTVPNPPSGSDPGDPPIVPPNFGQRNIRLLSSTDRFLLIESVGRPGRIDPADPTSFLSTPTPRLRRAVVAAKSIGLVDYLRFVTNLYNESKFEAALGVPPISVPNPNAPDNALPVWMQLGGLPVRMPDGISFTGRNAMGANIQVNGNLRLLNNTTLALDAAKRELVAVAGEIRVEPEDPNATPDPAQPFRRQARLNNLATTAPNADPIATPLGVIRDSRDPQFSTFGGLLRVGAPRVEPPVIDAADPASGVPRYLLLTRDSGTWITQSNGRSFHTGRVGLGAGMYIRNFASVERESIAVAGGQSLRSIWLQPGSSQNWSGPYYIPPGVYIEFGYPVVAEGSGGSVTYVRRPGMRIVRDVVDRPWFERTLMQSTREQTFSFFIYKPAGQRPVIKLDNWTYREFLRNDQGLTDAQIDKLLPEFNGIILAEGNIRTRGLLPSKANLPIRREQGDPHSLTDSQIRQVCNPPSVTLVSGSNIYIEGSLVRESPASMIGLLAVNNVVVNTTMFVSPSRALTYSSGQNNQSAPAYARITTTGEPLTLDFLYGENPAGYTMLAASQPVGAYLLLDHGTPGPITYLNLLINEAIQPGSPPPAGYALYRFGVPGVQPWVYPLESSDPDAATYEKKGFQLLPKPNASVFAYTGDNAAGLDYRWPMGMRNTIRPAVDTTFVSGAGTQDYEFGRAAVVPMDVRIEAVIYAQTGSFFIIPGRPMNEDPNDTRSRALGRSGVPGQMLRPIGPTAKGPLSAYDLYPFYGEPIDCRISVIGSITENRTASPADQAAWMQLWGWMPQAYGSTGYSPYSSTRIQIPREHAFVTDVGQASPVDFRTRAEQRYFDPSNNVGVGRGIRFIYDPALYLPFEAYSDANAPFRRDDYGFDGNNPGRRFGRVLPPVPKLPVSPDYLFFGELRS
jgi:hypothetical protein